LGKNIKLVAFKRTFAPESHCYMRIFKQLSDLPPFNRAIITIGTFDGVHAAHRQIITSINSLAQQHQGESVLITFDPHPRKVINKEQVGLLSPLNEKLGLLQYTGLQNVVVIPFTDQFAQQTPEQYINDFLYQYFKPHYIVIGYDHRYGKNRQGNLALLQQYSHLLHYKVAEIEQQLIDDIAISSTKIRQALLCADLATANTLLGYAYQLQGTVVKGKQLGRTIGFPTANLQLNEPDKLLPAKGVYAVTAQIDHNKPIYKAMLNIGTRPTINPHNDNTTIEVHLLDFPPQQEIYGQQLTLSLHEYIRPEQKFDNLQALKTQIEKDSLVISSMLNK
jgi:riboflavin kinase/FMN adenylyltransferase